MADLDLISPAYLDEQRRLHALGGYGIAGDRYALLVARLAASIEARTILDYGCGSRALERALAEAGLWISGYDPAIPDAAQRPAPADLLVCTDVLEHIEPERIKAVGRDLRGLARRAAFVTVSLREAGKRLSDGRNAHILLRSPEWWRHFFDQRGFRVKAERIIEGEEWAALLRPR